MPTQDRAALDGKGEIMATKAELRAAYIADGWTVQPVASWAVRGLIDNVTWYDVAVFPPGKDSFFTAQVVVTDDDVAGSESAEARGKLVVVVPDATFDAELRTYLDTLEGNSSIFAISVTQSFSTDKVAEVKAYLEDSSTATYVVKQRADTFSFKALT